MGRVPVDKIHKILKSKEVIFWDFDGVIKDSLDVKADAFVDIFKDIDQTIKDKIRRHHLENGGVSRFDKIPLYMEWVSLPLNEKSIQAHIDAFAAMVTEKVVVSQWVPGVKEYLEENFKNQEFVLVTATPQREIEEILIKLGISHFFQSIHGSPISKSTSLAKEIEKRSFSKDKFLMVGDSSTDLEAALANEVPFVLRRTKDNDELAKRFAGYSFKVL